MKITVDANRMNIYIPDEEIPNFYAAIHASIYANQYEHLTKEMEKLMPL